MAEKPCLQSDREIEVVALLLRRLVRSQVTAQRQLHFAHHRLTIH